MTGEPPKRWGVWYTVGMHIFVFRLRFKEHRGRSETVVERVVPDTIIIISSSSACARALDPSLIAIGDRSVGPRWPSPTRQTGRPRYAHCLNRITCITERITSARDRTTRAVCRVRVVRTRWPVERRAGSRRASKRATFGGVYGFRLLGTFILIIIFYYLSLSLQGRKRGKKR